MAKRGRGQPKTFESGEQLIALWKEFCTYITDNDYFLAPTQTEFSKWLEKNMDSGDRRTIYNSLNEYFPEVKSEFEEIRADVITQGTMLGKYQPTMSIFALKNWCHWTDRAENVNTNTDKVIIDFSGVDDE